MSRTPEVVIVKWRKFVHDLFMGVSGLSVLVALVSFLVGGNFVPALLLWLATAYVASTIKFKLVKKIEVGGYELV